MANYILLEKITVGAAGASSVTFNNIPQTGYTDLKVVFSTRQNASGVGHTDLIQFNGISTGYSSRILEGAGSGSPTSFTGTNSVGLNDGAGATSNTFSNCEVYIPNYLSSNPKSYSADSVLESNGTTAYQHLVAGLWTYTGNPAITSITFSSDVGTYVQYSTFSLYALAAVGTTPTKAPKAIGGDIIQTDGTYWYHAFLSSGSFTPQTALSCDYLVVAGGAGGTYAGGGAGGLRSTVTTTGGGGSLDSALALIANTSYTVTIGAGGAGANPTSANGTNSSIIGGAVSITSLGGGGSTVGGSNTNGNSGGSGGGGGGAGGTGGAGTTNQGYAGGAGISGASAGGGGAGVAGSPATSGNGGGGGNGIYTAITDGINSLVSIGQSSGGHYYFAGGGGGSGSSNGAGGTGGGGAAGSSSGTAGTPNTGGGGGGGGSGTGATGGSGIVIVRYAY